MPTAGPTARSLILDLLSTVRRGHVPVSALLQAGELFGLGENRVRVALARLRTAEMVESGEPCRYRLTPRAAVIREQVASWRHAADGLRSWTGGWIGVHTAGLSRTDRPALRRRSRALRLVGFRPARPGLEIRPDNLRAGVSGARDRLRTLGVEKDAVVFAMSQLDTTTRNRALELWDAGEIRQAYAASLAALEASGQRLLRLDRDSAMVESFLLGGRVIRQLALDPLLPDEIVPTAERKALVEAMRRYERLGRACWAGRLGVSTSAQRSTPADLSGGFDASLGLAWAARSA